MEEDDGLPRPPGHRGPLDAAGLSRAERRLRVPHGKVEDIGRFDRSIVVDTNYGELSYCSDSEKIDFLALNLADEIARGRKTAAQARGIYAKVSALAAAGKSSPYLEGFIFKPGRAGVIYGKAAESGYE